VAIEIGFVNLACVAERVLDLVDGPSDRQPVDLARQQPGPAE
jgi:hypothetical protein